MNRAAVVSGLGTRLPDRLITNEEVTRGLNTSAEWITSRTGIRTRYWAPPGVSTGDLAVEAGRRALESAGVPSRPGAVDAVVLATTTPDFPCPATAPEVAHRLGLGSPAAFDVSAVCSGFVYALANARALIVSGQSESVLVIAAETYSTILDPTDRTTAVIFGDGAGAVVLTAGTEDADGAILGVDLGSDGSQRSLITIPAGGSWQRSARTEPEPQDRYFQMRGKEVFAQAVTRMAASSQALAERVGWRTDEVDHLVGHQANLRILKRLTRLLDLPEERAVVNVDKVGNTSAASIPLALADAAAEGRLKTGDRLLLTAFGGGLTWGSAALTWPDVTPA